MDLLAYFIIIIIIMVFILYFTVHNQQLLPLRIFITDHVSLHDVSTEQQTRKKQTPNKHSIVSV